MMDIITGMNPSDILNLDDKNSLMAHYPYYDFVVYIITTGKFKCFLFYFFCIKWICFSA